MSDRALLERGFLEWVVEDCFARLRRAVPEGEADAAVERARREIGDILCHAPLLGDPVDDLRDRAVLAAVFGAIHPDDRPEDAGCLGSARGQHLHLRGRALR